MNAENIVEQDPLIRHPMAQQVFLKSVIGRKYKHVHGHIYTITGYSWCGDTDEWHVLHSREGVDITFSRSFDNFFGMHPTGSPRFTKA